jgi:DMSO/TMAO reductase YedYZ molybdopterin-dependent catalytic subunit
MKEAYIAAKERWARKMAGKEKPAVRPEGRLPPGQRQVHNFPVLDLGVKPEIPRDRWELRIGGHVENPLALRWEDFTALPQFQDTSDSTNNPLDVCMDDDVLVAHTWNGAPLPVEHGGPARVIVPKRYAWKGAKWIREITFMDRDILGFWEVRGYSNTADPFTEDRFS